VVDSQSDDATVSVAKEYTDHVFEHPFENHVLQWTWALEQTPIENRWVLALDADFLIPPELRSAVDAAIARDDDVAGFYLRRLFVFRGRPIRHGGVYPSYQLRLFRRDAVYLDTHDVNDQHFYVRGRTERIDEELIEENVKERRLSFWIEKQNAVAQRQALEEVAHRAGRVAPEPPSLFGTHNQKVLWMKNRWVRLPLYWRSVGYFLYRYIVRGGFLDGRQGFLYHLTQALLYRVMLDARVEELRSEQPVP
jgi:glycosyltransferase involved in cell wall biosynthesis